MEKSSKEEIAELLLPTVKTEPEEQKAPEKIETAVVAAVENTIKTTVETTVETAVETAVETTVETAVKPISEQKPAEPQTMAATDSQPKKRLAGKIGNKQVENRAYP